MTARVVAVLSVERRCGVPVSIWEHSCYVSRYSCAAICGLRTNNDTAAAAVGTSAVLLPYFSSTFQHPELDAALATLAVL